MKASIVIPTKNAGPLFKKVLNAVLGQETPWRYEVLVIDSGSSDDTVEYCRGLGDEKLHIHTIPAREFGHGRTRNLGISMTSGEFIALITQDALPANQFWLRNLVAAVEQAPDVAGAFGRHLPYPDANPYVARDLQLHFDGFLQWGPIFRLDDAQRYERDVGYRQVLHFFSDNNACIRRSVWDDYPYPDVDFAEDQIWAKRIIEAGYGKAYADDARVFHSHNYSVIELGRRSFDEANALFNLFGYRLCPNVRQLVGHFLWGTYGDFAYSWHNKALLKHGLWLAKSPFLNLSRQLGFYCGERAHKIDPWLRNRISLDQSNKARNQRQ